MELAHRQTGRQTDRQKDRQIDRQTDQDRPRPTKTDQDRPRRTDGQSDEGDKFHLKVQRKILDEGGEIVKVEGISIEENIG